MEYYLVGGAVRDKLLGQPIKERDWVVVGATPAMMLQQGFKEVGKDFPVFLHPKTKEEYALARLERKTAKGYHGFHFTTGLDVRLEDDLQRRDLTINAMAETQSGELIDPYGGKRDLDAHLLRHVSPAFSEDPVRILRVARFAARYDHLGFRVADETMALMEHMVASGEVDALVAERVWKECERALMERSPHIFFEVLHNCGALARLFPELSRLAGVPNPYLHHPEIDTYVHTMMVLQKAAALSDDPCVRFAALCHDLGKAETPAEKWPRHPGHEASSAKLVTQLCRRLRIPNQYKELAVLCARYHLHTHRAFELKPSTLLDLLEKMDVFRRPERFAQFLLVCKADFCGRTGFEQREYAQEAFLHQVMIAAKQARVNDQTEAGLSGEAIRQLLRKRRLHEIRKICLSSKRTADKATP